MSAGTTMPGVSILQPYAWAVIHAGKRVENRPMRPPQAAVGGRMAIQAMSRRVDIGDVRRVHESIHAERGPTGLPPLPVPLFGPEEYGAILGTVRLAGWVMTSGHNEPLDWYFADGDQRIARARQEVASPWRIVDRRWPCAWILEDPRPLATPLQYRGMPGIWYVGEYVQGEIEDQDAQGERLAAAYAEGERLAVAEGDCSCTKICSMPLDECRRKFPAPEAP